MSDKVRDLEYYDTHELMYELCKRHRACVIVTVRPGEKGAYTEFLLRRSEHTTPLIALHMMADAVKMISAQAVVEGQI